MRILIFTLLLGAASLFFLPNVSFAALVPCNGVECQTCHFIQLGSNIITWLITIMATICAIVVAIAGFKMVTAGGDAGAVSEARGMITNVVVGFVILLSAWLVVDTVMKMFVKDNVEGYGPWNQIQCVTQPQGGATTTPITTGTTTPGVVAGSAGCSTCTAFPSSINIKSGACGGGGACTISPEIVNQLTNLDSSLDAAGINWRVTEAYPPTRTHRDSCHQNGTCIDANCIGGCNASQVQTFVQSASTAGLRAVYEVSTQAQKDALVNSGVPAGSVSVLGGWISSPHFSVYKI